MKKTAYELLLDRLGTGNVLTRQEIEMFKSLVERPYKVYTALLTQSGTDAPVATVLENTIGNIVWSYFGTGAYVGTLTNAFPYAKTCSIPMLSGYYSAVTEGTVTIQLQANMNNDSEFLISIIDGTGTEINDALQNHPIEIRVYP